MSDADDSCEEHHDEAASASHEPNDEGYDETVTAYESMFITTDEDEPVFSLVSTELNAPATVAHLGAEPYRQSNGDTIVDQSSTSLPEEAPSELPIPLDDSNCSQLVESTADRSVDYLHDPDWLNKNEHVFILSTAGKPIYSLHGSEDRLASLFGVLQALVSIFQSNQDTIVSIHAIGIQFAYLVRPPLILVAASRKPLSVQQIQLQLT